MCCFLDRGKFRKVSNPTSNPTIIGDRFYVVCIVYEIYSSERVKSRRNSYQLRAMGGKETVFGKMENKKA